MESSRRDLFIDMVEDRFILKNNRITLSPCCTFVYLKQVLDYLKQGLVFTEYFMSSYLCKERRILTYGLV